MKGIKVIDLNCLAPCKKNLLLDPYEIWVFPFEHQILLKQVANKTLARGQEYESKRIYTKKNAHFMCFELLLQPIQNKYP